MHAQTWTDVFHILECCGWQYWGSLFLQAGGQCGAAFVYFVPHPHFSKRLSYPFLLFPHYFCMRSLCTDSLRPYFSLPWGFIHNIQCYSVPYLHLATHLTTKTSNQFSWWHLVSPDSDDLFPILLTAHLSFSHSLQQGLVPSKCLLGLSMT